MDPQGNLEAAGEARAGGRRVRARAFGLTIGTLPPGPHNAITDVSGVTVGHTTLIRSGPSGTSEIRTGVTAVIPRADIWSNGLFAATHTLNGDGEMTGTHWIRDLETLTHPVILTGTRSVGAVYDAALAYVHDRHPNRTWGFLPVVAETWDGLLHDIRIQVITPADVYAAIDGARGGAVAEGGVGSGTGMVCYDFKGGIGTSSRQLPSSEGGFVVGILIQANFGSRRQLIVDGVPVGRTLTDLMPKVELAAAPPELHEGSAIIVVATDAPLSAAQLHRLARRAGLGMSRTGSISANTSGDIVIAFSTGNVVPLTSIERTLPVTLLSTSAMDPLFQAVVEATEEAVLNALLMGDTMSGNRGNVVYGLPYERLEAVLAEHGRKAPGPARA